MKTKYLVLFSALLVSAASFTHAQDAGQPPAGKDGEPVRHNPLLALFDTNHDGVISADEIANDPAVLNSLDKNGDGQLITDELRPPRPKDDRKANMSPPPPRRSQLRAAHIACVLGNM